MQHNYTVENKEIKGAARLHFFHTFLNVKTHIRTMDTYLSNQKKMYDFKKI